MILPAARPRRFLIKAGAWNALFGPAMAVLIGFRRSGALNGGPGLARNDDVPWHDVAGWRDPEAQAGIQPRMSTARCAMSFWSWMRAACLTNSWRGCGPWVASRCFGRAYSPRGIERGLQSRRSGRPADMISDRDAGRPGRRSPGPCGIRRLFEPSPWHWRRNRRASSGRCRSWTLPARWHRAAWPRPTCRVRSPSASACRSG